MIKKTATPTLMYLWNIRKINSYDLNIYLN